jgi:hypothetical protein
MLGSSARQQLFSKLRPRENFPLRAYSVYTAAGGKFTVVFPGSGNGTSAIPMCQTAILAGVSQVYGRSGHEFQGFGMESKNCAGRGSLDRGEVAAQEGMVQN